MTSKNPKDRFKFLLDEVNLLSTVVSSHGSQLSVLSDQMVVTRCQLYEDNCGRINQENLNRFMVMGAPYFPLSNDLQDKLKQQVKFLKVDWAIGLGLALPFIARIFFFLT